MTSDDLDDIRVGLESLRKALQSIQAARRAIEKMRESHEKRDAGIALQHAEEMAAVAERLSSSVLGENGRR